MGPDRERLRLGLCYALGEMRFLVFLGLRYVRFALIMRYAPRLLHALFRERVPPFIRRPIVWWLVRRLLP